MAKAIILYAKDGYQLDVIHQKDGVWIGFHTPKKHALINASMLTTGRGGVIDEAINEFLRHALGEVI